VPAIKGVNKNVLIEASVRFCKLAGYIVVNYKESDHIKVISEEFL